MWFNGSVAYKARNSIPAFSPKRLIGDVKIAPEPEPRGRFAHVLASLSRSTSRTDRGRRLIRRRRSMSNAPAMAQGARASRLRLQGLDRDTGNRPQGAPQFLRRLLAGVLRAHRPTFWRAHHHRKRLTRLRAGYFTDDSLEVRLRLTRCQRTCPTARFKTFIGRIS
jgi:hypothetical protein